MPLSVLAAAALLSQPMRPPGAAPTITNGKVSVTAVGSVGFDVRTNGKTAAVVRFSSLGLIEAGKAVVAQDRRSITFSHLASRAGTGLRLGDLDCISVSLKPNDPYPVVSFDLRIAAFDPEKWQAVAGKQPFHFLAMSMPDAEVWHQCGWLNETPVADPFPLLQDVHVGTPEISAYKYNRNWSYTVPLGGHPVPVIGLWAPKSKHYVGLEFQSTRLTDNSEKDIATGYCWGDGTAQVRKPNPSQFACLVYPHGGRGFQDLVYPHVGSRIRSHGTLLWSLDLPATKDPNRLYYGYAWDRYRDRLPNAPSVVDLSWLPGNGRLVDFAAPGSAAGKLIGGFAGIDAEFAASGTKAIHAWTAYNESFVALARTRGDTALQASIEDEARRLLGYAKSATIDGDDCLFWEHPIEGRWTDRWGGAPVTTIHNPHGFAAGRLLLGLYRFMGKQEYLPAVDKVLNWAKHVGWTRNELADIPSSPSGIGMLPTAAFCLDYYMTFKDAPDEEHRRRARESLDLARTFAYRYMPVWLSDNNRMDNLAPTFQWEATSGRDWTGSSCTADMMLDVLAMVAVHTGDPLLMRVVNGSLSRFHDLYQETYRSTIADYRASDFSEAYGFYDGSTSGVGRRVPFGGFFQMVMLQPPGSALARVLAGERAAMVFNKSGVHTSIRNYRYSGDGNLSFAVRTRRPRLDLAVTVPYVDISARQVVLVRRGKPTTLVPGIGYVRPPQAAWSVLIKDIVDGDLITIGRMSSSAGRWPHAPTISRATLRRPSAPGFEFVRLPFDATPSRDWDRLDSWAGMPSSEFWSYGVPFHLMDGTTKCTVTRTTRLRQPIRGARSIVLLYGAGSGPAPSIILSDGSRRRVDTQREALAWRAWPAVYTSRLVVAPADVTGTTVTGIDPGGRPVWAATAWRPAAARASTGGADHVAAMAAGAKDWRAIQADDRASADLRAAASRVPSNSVAVLPPSAGGPTNDFLQRSGLLERAVAVTPEQLVDPVFFSAKRFAVALYAGDGHYVHTVRVPGDGANAIVRYVKEGGTLLLCAPGATWPFYLADGPGGTSGDPLTDRLGMPLDFAVDEKQPEPLHFKEAAGQMVLRDVPDEFAWPPGDIRLRVVARDRLPSGSRYTPIYTVVGKSGKDYGDAAALVELPSGGGRVLFVFGILTAHLDHGSSIARAAVRYLVDSAVRAPGRTR